MTEAAGRVNGRNTTTSGQRRTRGTSAGLTREAVLSAAQRVIEDVGFEATSLRAVATRLDVSPAAIYHHVEDKSDLLDAVADAFVAREVLADLPPDLPPVDAVRELGRRLNRAGVDHPGLLLAIVGHLPERAPSAQEQFGERLLGLLVEAGATPDRAQLLCRVIVSLAAGSAAAESNRRRPSRSTLAERRRRHVEASDRPALALMLQQMPSPGDAGEFDQQLDMVLGEFHA